MASREKEEALEHCFIRQCSSQMEKSRKHS